MSSNPIGLLEAKRILTDERVVGIGRALLKSIETWREVHFPTAGLGPTARATVISDHFYQYAVPEMLTDDGAEYDERHNQKFLTFDDRLLLRCKHLDGALRSANYPTPTAEAF